MPSRHYAILSLLFVLSGPLTAGTASTVTLLTSTNPAAFGSPVTLTATVSPSAATGRVTFYDGAAVLGISRIAGGQAILSTSLLGTGIRPLRAHYGGDATYSASDSASMAETVVSIAAAGFQAAVNYPAGSAPTALTTGDFNGDGVRDLVVCDSAGGTLGVLLGNGNGTFHPAVWYAVGLNPPGVAVADFDGDGIADLVTTSYSGVSVLKGVGDGSFAAAVVVYPLSSPGPLAVGDFNGDGKADVVVSTFTDLRMLLGNGDGTFTAMAPQGLPVNGPIGLALGDFDGDGQDRHRCLEWRRRVTGHPAGQRRWHVPRGKHLPHHRSARRHGRGRFGWR